jgi:hypothetical protein
MQYDFHAIDQAHALLTIDLTLALRTSRKRCLRAENGVLSRYTVTSI